MTKRKMLAACALGALSALAFAPFNLWPLLWFAFPALYLLVMHAEKKRQAFAFGWSFAFGQLVVSFHWIAGALFVDIHSFWWALPFAIAGLPAFFALYYGLAAMASYALGLRGGQGIFAFAFFWFLASLARARLLTGFPWNIEGYVWADWLAVLQSVSLAGIEGLTLATILFALLPVCFFVIAKRKHAALFFGLGISLFALLAAWGQMRLHQAQENYAEHVYIRLVQPDLRQVLKWQPEQARKNLDDLMALSFEAPAQRPLTHYVWPETAAAYKLAQETELRKHIAQAMQSGSILLTGVLRTQKNVADEQLYYNSLIAIDSQANVIAGYDKYHLVPFGEYMPFSFLRSVPSLAMMGTPFTPGPGPRTLRVPNLPPFSPLICYEAIFSGAVTEREDPPKLLVNITNDAWYEGTIGPIQHFLIARTRAVEEGLPLMRVSNMGVTGVFDAYGKPVAMIAQKDGKSFVDSMLPKALPELTPMARHGEKTLLTLVIFMALTIAGHKLFWNRKK
ncbi:MAG: apolipoprotein N-acyltransferase [Alphaproteobacteria bacterium]|nr:apolipoprotein N-acyltransferase [Alphaproteobacteria bacterium]